MKKLLLLAGILVVGATSFAAGVDKVEQDGEASGVLNVSAEVVEDLKVATEPVKFGKVAGGMTNLQPKEKGKIIIEGVEGAKVKIGLYEIGNDNAVLITEDIELKAGNTEETLTYYPKFGVNGEEIVHLDGVTKKEISVEGTLDVPVGAPAGYYSRDLLVKAKYTSFDN